MRAPSIVEITRRFEFDMGHRVTNHEGLCKNLHGHRYVVLATIEGIPCRNPEAPAYGMVADFSSMKGIIQPVIDELDHGFMVWSEDPFCQLLLSTGTKIITVDFPPTAEELAKYLFDRIAVLLPESTKLKTIRVYETPNCYADAQGQ